MKKNYSSTSAAHRTPPSVSSTSHASLTRRASFITPIFIPMRNIRKGSMPWPGWLRSPGFPSGQGITIPSNGWSWSVVWNWNPRCEECIRDRLRRTATEAKEDGFNAFAAVLTVSPHKDAAMVNRLGTEAGEEYGIEYIPTDLKNRTDSSAAFSLQGRWGSTGRIIAGASIVKGRRQEGGGRRKNRVKPSFGIKDHIIYHQHPNINASKAPLFP